MPMAVIDSGNIHYKLEGKGKPIIMLLPQSKGPVGVGPFIHALAQSLSVICYDQRGTGKSSSPLNEKAMSIEGRASEVIDLLDTLDLNEAYFCCHSTGCGIGLAVASIMPELVKALILLNPWRNADSHMITMQNLRIAAAKSLDPYDYAKFNASLLFPPEYRLAYEVGFEQMAKAAKSAPQDTQQIEKRLNSILAFDTRLVTHKITCPTLIIVAKDDQLMPAWFGRQLETDISDTRLVVLDGGGHMLPETRGSEVISEIIPFIIK